MDIRLIENLIRELEGEGMFREPKAVFRIAGNDDEGWRIHVRSPEACHLIDRILNELGEELTVEAVLREHATMPMPMSMSLAQACHVLVRVHATLARYLAYASRLAGLGAAAPYTRIDVNGSKPEGIANILSSQTSAS